MRLPTDIGEKLTIEFSCYDDAKNAVNNQKTWHVEENAMLFLGKS